MGWKRKSDIYKSIYDVPGSVWVLYLHQQFNLKITCPGSICIFQLEKKPIKNIFIKDIMYLLIKVQKSFIEYSCPK